jgi:hypothetical protein
MGARLVILVLIAGGLAVYFAVRPKASPQVIEVDDPSVGGVAGPIKTVAEQPIDGREPPEKPDIQVKVEVDTALGRNRLIFTISEAHGYYVDTIDLLAWRKGEVSGPENSPLRVTYHMNNYLKANETQRACVDIVPAELSKVGGDIGKTEDWEVQVIRYGRAREKNPNPLPEVAEDASGCRD